MLGRPHLWFRYRQIAEVLARHGLMVVVENIGLTVPWHRLRLRRLDRSSQAIHWTERVRRALIELGPTYIKLGQLASTRSDVLPQVLVDALETLQDNVEPFDFDIVQEIVEEAWKQPLNQAVARFDRTPLATASIGQVHGGSLADGREIVIKVRRPGIVRKSRADFEILHQLAELAQQRTAWGKRYDVLRLVDDLIRTLTTELDFTVEAANTERAARNLQHNRWARVPAVVWPLSGESVLVLERIEGVKISDRDRMLAMGVSPHEAATHLVATLYQQIFEDGFFHADPHPGNIHVDAESRLIWLDWGLAGRFSDDMKHNSVELIMGLTTERPDRVVRALINLSAVENTVDADLLKIQIEALRHRYYDTALQEFEVGKALVDLFALAQRFQITIPSEYTLLAKTAVLVDGLVRRLDPKLSLVDLSKPFAARMIWKRADPRRLWDQASKEIESWSGLIDALPDDLAQALKSLSRGEVHIVMEHKNIDMIFQQWERFVNRLGLSFILGSIILGTATVVHPDELDRLFHFQVGEYVFVVAILLGIAVVLHAVRKGKL